VTVKVRTFLGSAAVCGVVIAGISKQGAPVAGGTPQEASVAAVPASVNGNVALGQKLAAGRYGWTGGQFTCLYDLWQGESGWSQYADTEVSGLTAPGQPFAYGIPQAYPGTKMPLAAQPASAGGSSDPTAQIGWGLQYIDQTYGSPCAALDFKQSHGDKGY
jgi:hypothetical protein